MLYRIDPEHFKVQGINGNPIVFSWGEFLDHRLEEYNSSHLVNRPTSLENLDFFLCGFGRWIPSTWVIRLPIIEKIIPNDSDAIPRLSEAIEYCGSLGLKTRYLLSSVTEIILATDDPDVQNKLFILKLCF